MSENSQRRQRSRHALRWKAAIAFDGASGRPVTHTQTEDLSASGAAVFSEYADLTGSNVTLLLASPAPKGHEAPLVLKMQARVVSSVRTPEMSRYRHGLMFVRSPNDGLDKLALLLEDITAGTRRAAPVAPVAPVSKVPPDVPTLNRLDLLKQQAQSKLAQAKAAPPVISPAERIDKSLKRAYQYLKELVEQLNVIKPLVPNTYSIAGVPEFNGLAWDIGYVNTKMRDIAYKTTHHELVFVHFVLSGSKDIRVNREYPASEKVRQLLTDSKIEFQAQEMRNARGSIERMVFDFPCKVVASLQFSADSTGTRLLLQTSNVSGFGAYEHVLEPEAITDDSLNELSGFILGESRSLGPLLLRGQGTAR